MNVYEFPLASTHCIVMIVMSYQHMILYTVFQSTFHIHTNKAIVILMPTLCSQKIAVFSIFVSQDVCKCKIRYQLVKTVSYTDVIADFIVLPNFE